MAVQSRRSSTKKTSKRRASRSVDFTDVESGGRTITDGWARGRVKAAVWKESQSSDNEMIEVQWMAERGKEKATVYDNMVNTPSALWKMKTMLEACGIEVPEGAMDVDAGELVDLECDIEIVNEEFDNRDRPRIVGFAETGTHTEDGGSPKEGAEDPEAEEEEEAPKRKRKTSEKEEEEEEPEEEPEEEEEEEEKPSRSKKRRTPKEEEEEEPEEEEEEEEEEEAPKKKTKSKIRAGAKVSFRDGKKTLRGVVKSIEDDQVLVVMPNKDEYEMSSEEVTLA
jgi:hypothetical protein